MVLSISSPTFNDGEKIPAKFTCDGQDISPQLDWSGIPKGTESLTLIVEDPDAPGGIFTHWMIFNISPDNKGLSEATPAMPKLPDGSLQVDNDFGRMGYGGPCPPPGKPHRYHFTLYALDRKLDLAIGSSRNQVLNGIKNQILAKGRLTGIYQRFH
ncbi:MAG: YbhB/YbcL family Raf kinase inhibitor-like protein [Dehalococcoidia bacterium]|nr:MAG: YbhB/YbcL family Raf kinase inhibitor-like protein [Dehalococcoidia bacterium]